MRRADFSRHDAEEIRVAICNLLILHKLRLFRKVGIAVALKRSKGINEIMIQTSYIETGRQQKNRRSLMRIRFSAPFHYKNAGFSGGYGEWINLGRGGALVRLARAQAPGSFIMLQGASKRDRSWELKARVVWSAQDPIDGNVLVGLRILLDSAEASSAISHLLYDAYEAAGEIHNDDERSARSKLLSVDPEWALPSQNKRTKKNVVRMITAAVMPCRLANHSCLTQVQQPVGQ